MERTTEAQAVMRAARVALEPIFQESLLSGINPAEFCFLVNEEATRLSLRHIVSVKLGNSGESAKKIVKELAAGFIKE